MAALVAILAQALLLEPGFVFPTHPLRSPQALTPGLLVPRTLARRVVAGCSLGFSGPPLSGSALGFCHLPQGTLIPLFRRLLSRSLG